MSPMHTGLSTSIAIVQALFRLLFAHIHTHTSTHIHTQFMPLGVILNSYFSLEVKMVMEPEK